MMDAEDLKQIEIRAMKQEEAERLRLKNKKPTQQNSDSDMCKFPDVTPEEMMKLRMANVSEEKVADYFGKTVEELRALLEKNDVLKLIYDAGPGRGKAKVQVTQYTTALEGDPTMLKHFGEHNLNQKSKVTHDFEDKAILVGVIQRIEAALEQKKVTKQIASNVIDAEATEIEDAN